MSETRYQLVETIIKISFFINHIFCFICQFKNSLLLRSRAPKIGNYFCIKKLFQFYFLTFTKKIK